MEIKPRVRPIKKSVRPETAQQVKVLATKPDDPNSICRTMDEEDRHLQVVLWLPSYTN